MNSSLKKVRGLGLCSGGLDSIISAYILKKQGIEIEWVTFETPFFSSSKARMAANAYKIPITVKNITPVYLEMLKNPPCGYGKNMNPCMDCHALMFQLAGEMMKQKNFNFLFSGEVVGQRPMSQTKTSLRYVEKRSGYTGYILRPLSARLLPETIPEIEKLVDREQLLDISGRSRKHQINWAEELGIHNYPTPAGGCRLTEKAFSDRLKDLFKHQDSYAENELHLLKYGRHLRLNANTKLIVGRNQKDNSNIEKYYNPDGDILIVTDKYPGPTVVLPHGGDRESILQAASICVGYSKTPDNGPVDVNITDPQGIDQTTVKGTRPDQLRDLII